MEKCPEFLNNKFYENLSKEAKDKKQRGDIYRKLSILFFNNGLDFQDCIRNNISSIFNTSKECKKIVNRKILSDLDTKKLLNENEFIISKIEKDKQKYEQYKKQSENIDSIICSFRNQDKDKYNKYKQEYEEYKSKTEKYIGEFNANIENLENKIEEFKNEILKLKDIIDHKNKNFINQNNFDYTLTKINKIKDNINFIKNKFDESKNNYDINKVIKSDIRIYANKICNQISRIESNFKIEVHHLDGEREKNSPEFTITFDGRNHDKFHDRIDKIIQNSKTKNYSILSLEDFKNKISKLINIEKRMIIEIEKNQIKVLKEINSLKEDELLEKTIEKIYNFKGKFEKKFENTLKEKANKDKYKFQEENGISSVELGNDQNIQSLYEKIKNSEFSEEDYIINANDSEDLNKKISQLKKIIYIAKIAEEKDKTLKANIANFIRSENQRIIDGNNKYITEAGERIKTLNEISVCIDNIKQIENNGQRF